MRLRQAQGADRVEEGVFQERGGRTCAMQRHAILGVGSAVPNALSRQSVLFAVISARLRVRNIYFCLICPTNAT